MNIGFVVGVAFGETLVPSLLVFPLCALAIQNQRNAKLGWPKTLASFAMAVGIMTSINTVLFLAVPSLLTSKDLSYFGIAQTFVLPLVASAGTLLLWKPVSSHPTHT